MASPFPTRRAPDELRPGDVALLGLPWDEHSSFLRGAAEAPERIRAALRSPAGNACTESLRDLAREERFVDLGDVALEDGPDAPARIEDAVAEVVRRGARPLALGGDHAVTYPILRALGPAHAGLTVLHFDAHPDLYDELDGDPLSHASPFARTMEAGLVRRLVQVGIRAMTPHQRDQAERFGVEVVEARAPRGATALALVGPLYVSLDLDVLDPAFAPGVSHYEPGGLSVRDVLDVVQAIDVPLVGADVVELNPRRDLQDRTAWVAAKLVKELADRMLAAPGS